MKCSVTEYHFFQRAQPDYSSLDEGLGANLSSVETVLRCDNYVDTEKAIPPIATRAVNTAAAVVRIRLL